MKTINIFDEIKNLNLPVGKYVIVGSGIMAALGIREVNDIDLLVIPDIFEEFKKDPTWHITNFTDSNSVPYQTLKKGLFEVDKKFCYKDYQPKTNDLIKNATIKNDWCLICLISRIKWKK